MPLNTEGSKPANDVAHADAAIRFWQDAGPKAWYTRDEKFDADVRERFAAKMQAARGGACDYWMDTDRGALGLILVLDQFHRNGFRDTPEMFAADPAALAFANQAIDRGFDLTVDEDMRAFIYMPFMHSEAIADQERCVALFTQTCATPGWDENRKFAQTHLDIIAQFARFPHRNAILGRPSTPGELAFLKDGGFSG